MRHTRSEIWSSRPGSLTAGSLLHFIADNVEHYVKTLDGEDVIQMMGQMGAITPARPSKNKIPRIKVTLEEI